MKNDGEHQFRNIQRAEYSNLFAFIQAKGLRINNLAEQQEIAAQVRLCLCVVGEATTA